MAKENVPEDTQLTSLENRVKEMETQLAEVLKRTSGLTWNNRNWEAVKTTLEVQDQRFKNLEIQISSIKNLVMVLQNRFTQFEQQRAIELNKLLSNRQTFKDDDE